MSLTAAPFMSAGAALAAAGTPGVPQAPTGVFSEDFDSGTPGTRPLPLTSYTGGAASGYSSYTADPDWLSTANKANGWILNSQSTMPTTDTGVAANGGKDAVGGTQNAWFYLKAMANALGLAQGQGAASVTNSALAEMTNGGTQTAGVMFETAPGSGVTAQPGHYYMATVDVAMVHPHSVNSTWQDPLIGFNLLVDGTPVPIVSGLDPADATYAIAGYSPYNDPSAGAIYVSRVTSPAIMVPAGASKVGLQVLNSQTSGTGNDVAIDVPGIVDVTPQLDKSFSPGTIAAGQTSTLTFTVTNTSELGAKDGWTFTDNLPAGLVVASTPNVQSTVPNGTVTATAGATSITVSGDLTAGMKSATVSVDVTAAATGTYTNGPGNITATGVLPPGTTTLTTVPPVADIQLTKASDVTTVTAAGSVVTYYFTVTNTGNVPLTNVMVVDPMLGGVVGTIDSLAPGAVDTVQAPYWVTQADMDAGSIYNMATATGTPPGDLNPPSATSVAVVETLSQESIALEKTATVNDTDGDGKAEPGETISYTFAVTNTGNVTLENVQVTDPLLGGLVDVIGTLAPGMTVKVTAATPYTITDADAAAGVVENTATATGEAPDGTVVKAPDTATVDVYGTPSIALVKLATVNDADNDGRNDPGETVQYTFQATNTGNVPLTNITFDEPMALGTITGPATLAPGETATYTASDLYTLTGADAVAGEVVNTATVTGTDPHGEETTSPEATVTTPVHIPGGISIVKHATPVDTNGDGQLQPGEGIQYSFDVTNTGDVPLSDIDFTESMTIGHISGPATLQPGETATYTADDVYVITGADAKAGIITNTASVSGENEWGITVTSGPSTVTTDLVEPEEATGGTGVSPQPGGIPSVLTVTATATASPAQADAPIGWQVETGGTMAGTQWTGWLITAGAGLVAIAAAKLTITARAHATQKAHRKAHRA